MSAGDREQDAPGSFVEIHGLTEIFASQCEQRLIEKSGADQRHSKWKAIGTEACRDCNGCEIHQIDEVGVEAEIGIQPDRVRVDGLSCVDRSCCRQQQDIDSRPLFGSLLLQRFQ